MQLLLSRGLKTLLVCAACVYALPAQAAVRLVVEGVSGPLADNVRAHIGAPPDRGALRFFQSQAQQDALRALEALGYYNADVQVAREPDGDDTIVYVRIDPGPRVRIAEVDIRFSGDAAKDRAFDELRARLPLNVGAGLDHGEYETSKRAIQSMALRRGYFDGRFVQQRIAVDAVDNLARITLHFDSGQRYRMGEVSFSPVHFTDDLLARMVPFDEGDPYDTDLIGQLNRNLLDSRYFSEVRVLPQQDRAVQRHVPVDVELTERRPNQVGIGAGASTDTGPRLRLSWDRAWVNRHGHRFRSNLELAEVQQSLVAAYSLPLENPITDTLDFQVGFRIEEFEDGVDSERFTAAVQRQQYIGDAWRRTFSFRWEREHFPLIDERGEELPTNITSELFLPGMGWSRTRSRGGIDPYWGDRQLYNIEATHPLLGSNIALARGRAGFRLLRTYFERHRILLRADGGALYAEEFTQVPPSLRFLAGGDQSVRGFAYQSLGPGRYLLTGSLEYAYEFRPKWRLATFVDAGNAWRHLREDMWDDLAVGAGFGIQWVSPVGPIRFDFAWAVSEDPPPFRLHFSLGTQL